MLSLVPGPDQGHDRIEISELYFPVVFRQLVKFYLTHGFIF